jgi:hypothetical protein
VPDDGFYAKTENNDEGFSSIKLVVRNKSDTITLPEGALTLVVRYKELPCDAMPTDPSALPALGGGAGECNSFNESFQYITISSPTNMAISKEDPLEISFDMDKGQSIPINATDVNLCLFYKGQISYAEDKTVEDIAFGFKDICEPTPIDVINNEDWICIENYNGKDWYEAGSQAAKDQVNRWDIYEHDLQSIYIKISPFDMSKIQYASEALNDCAIDLLEAGHFIRKLYILSDKQFYVSMCITEIPKVLEDSALHKLNYILFYEGTSITHQRIWDEERKIDIYRYPDFYKLRGIQFWNGTGILLVNDAYPPDLNECLDASCYCDYGDNELNNDKLILEIPQNE